jgi:hypothetical protein
VLQGEMIVLSKPGDSDERLGNVTSSMLFCDEPSTSDTNSPSKVVGQSVFGKKLLSVRLVTSARKSGYAPSGRHSSNAIVRPNSGSPIVNTVSSAGWYG